MGRFALFGLHGMSMIQRLRRLRGLLTMDFSELVDFADAIYFLMAVPNIVGLYLLAPVVKREMDSYFVRLARGEIRPTREAPEHLLGSP